MNIDLINRGFAEIESGLELNFKISFYVIWKKNETNRTIESIMLHITI